MYVKRRIFPKSGDRLTDYFFKIIIDILNSISVKKTKELYNPKNRHEKNICGIISADRNEIYLNVKRHKKIKEPIVSTLIHEVLHLMMPDVRHKMIYRIEQVLFIRLTDAQKRYLRIHYIPRHSVAPKNINSI